jgi:hypothetical protein
MLPTAWSKRERLLAESVSNCASQTLAAARQKVMDTFSFVCTPSTSSPPPPPPVPSTSVLFLLPPFTWLLESSSCASSRSLRKIAQSTTVAEPSRIRETCGSDCHQCHDAHHKDLSLSLSLSLSLNVQGQSNKHQYWPRSHTQTDQISTASRGAGAS